MEYVFSIIALIVAGFSAYYSKKSAEETKRNVIHARKSAKEAERSADIAEASHEVTLQEKLYNTQIENIEQRKQIAELKEALENKEERDEFIKCLDKHPSFGFLHRGSKCYCSKCLSDYDKPIIPITGEGILNIDGNKIKYYLCHVCGEKYYNQ